MTKAMLAGHFAILLSVFVTVVAAFPPQTSSLQETHVVVNSIAQGQTQTDTIRIYEALRTDFTMLYGVGNLDLALVSPSGEVFDSTLTGPMGQWDESPFPFGGTMEMISLSKPDPGLWTLRVTAPRVEEPSGLSFYKVDAMVDGSPTRLELRDFPRLAIRQPLPLIARLTKSGEPIRNASVKSTIGGPGGEHQELTLVDSGIAPDSAAGDGFYTGTFTATDLPGQYSVLVRASGTGERGEAAFVRETSDGLLIARSDSFADIEEVLHPFREGRDQPPIEISTRLERDPQTHAVAYIYAVSNGSPYPIRSFEIGTDDRAYRENELESPPLGWRDRGGVPAGSYLAPQGWTLRYDDDRWSRGSLNWSARDTTAAISPGQTLTFRVLVAREDPSYERSHWRMFMLSFATDAYDGALVPMRNGAPKGDAMERLGMLQISTGPRPGETTIRFKAPRETRPEVAVVDGLGRPIQVFEPDSGGTGEHVVVWNGRNAAKQPIPAGRYFVRVQYEGTARYGRVTVGP